MSEQLIDEKPRYRLPNLLYLYYNIDRNIREKIYLTISLVSTILFFYGTQQIKPVDVGLENFLGLTSSLTFAYWTGLSVITLCSVLIYFDKELKNVVIYVISLMIFGLFIFAVPIFAESNAYMPYSYYPAGEVKTILKNGYIDTAKEYPLISYRQWPVIHFVTADMIYLGGIDLDNIIKFMPLFWMMTFILLSFSVGRALNLSLNKAFLLALLGSFSFWIPQYYYSAQSFALLTYLSILWVFLRSMESDKKEYLLLLIAFFSMAVMVHLLTSILIYLVIIALWIYNKYKNINVHFYTKIVWLYGIILMAWYVYLAPYAFKFGIREFIKQATQLDLLYFQSSTKFISTSPIKDSVNDFRYIYLIIYLICFIAATIFIYHKRYYRDHKIGSIFCWLMGIIPIVTIKYGVEVYERAFMFSIIPLMGIMILVFKNEKIMLALFLLLLIPHIPAHYGSASFELVRTSDLKGSEFFALSVAPKENYFYFYWNYIAYYNNSLVTVPHMSFSPWKYPNTTILDRSKYIIKSKSDDYMIRYYVNYNPLDDVYDEIVPNSTMMYDNGYYKILARR